jgi:arsenate reductase
MSKLLFLQKPSCTTCRKARAYLDSHHITYESRDLDKQRLSSSEIEELIGDRDYIPFLNPRNDLYRKLNMREKPPSRRKAIDLMAENPNLIRRPVVRSGKRILTGFDPAEYEKL